MQTRAILADFAPMQKRKRFGESLASLPKQSVAKLLPRNNSITTAPSSSSGRHKRVLATPMKFPIIKPLKPLVQGLAAGIAAIEKTRTIDPFMLAAKYCDRFVDVHPFTDGDGRMCRLILNAILIKFAGIVVVIGGKDSDRDEYLHVGAESSKVSGHP